MKAYTSCKDAINHCIKNESFAIAHLYSDEKPMNMHIHDCYELYFSISGGKQFLVDNKFYSINSGDIFFINQYESHHLTQITEEIHERIVLSIHPNYLEALSSPETDLNYCFLHREFRVGHKIHFHEEDRKRFLYFIHKLSDINGYGEDLLVKAIFVELLVFLNERFLNAHANFSPKKTSVATKTPITYQQVDSILTYINNNITNSLTTTELSEQFYLTQSYICRIFKQATGTTINKYITAKRITLAKSLLANGHTVYEACEQSGFRDYSNFLRSFTSAVGISPKKYSQFTHST